MLGLLFDRDGMAVLVEFHHAEALGVVHVIAEHRGAAVLLGLGHRSAQVLRKPVAVEDVVAQHQGAGIAVDEVLADDEGLRQAVGAGLFGVGQLDAVLGAVAQKRLESGQVGGRGYDQDVLDAREHERGKRVEDHGLIVYGKQLLRSHRGKRV